MLTDRWGEKRYTQEPIDGDSRTYKFRGSDYKFERYGLSVEGKAICVDEYCLMLAQSEFTHVVLIKDRGWVKEKYIDWTEPFNELK